MPGTLCGLLLGDRLHGAVRPGALRQRRRFACLLPDLTEDRDEFRSGGLDGFKRVNDLCGHTVGDHVLQVVVERFRRVARPTDLLARLGGDEFSVLSYDVDRTSAIAIGNRFMAALANAIATDGYLHEIGVAIGDTLLPDDGATCEEILHNADIAMYRAKAQPGSALAFFDTVVEEVPSVREAG